MNMAMCIDQNAIDEVYSLEVGDSLQGPDPSHLNRLRDKRNRDGIVH
jgi:hypothetical protein